MGKEQAKKFLEALERDTNLNIKFKEYMEHEDQSSEKNIIAFARNNGYDFNEEDIIECKKDFYELSDDELAHVDAGFRGFLGSYRRFGGSRSVKSTTDLASNIVDFIWRCKTGNWKAKGWCGKGEKK